MTTTKKTRRSKGDSQLNDTLRQKRGGVRTDDSEKKPPDIPSPPIEPLLSFASLSLNQQKFLSAYAQCGNLTRAAELAGLSRQAHYLWLAAEPEYVIAFKEASEVAVDLLINECRNRAMGGSDLLLIFLLKGLRPETFRDNHHLTLKGKVEHDGKIEHEHHVKELSTDERVNRISDLLQRADNRRRTAGPADAPREGGTRPTADSPSTRI